MSELRRAIAALADDFATKVLAAIRTASLSDIAQMSGGGAGVAGRGGRAAAAPARGDAPSGGRASGRRGGGRRRRTAADLEALGGRIVELLRGNPGGMRAEAIRDALGVARKELPRAFAQLLEQGAVRKEGQKRATTYFAGGGEGGGGTKRGAKKGAKRGGRRKKA